MSSSEKPSISYSHKPSIDVKLNTLEAHYLNNLKSVSIDYLQCLQRGNTQVCKEYYKLMKKYGVDTGRALANRYLHESKKSQD